MDNKVYAIFDGLNDEQRAAVECVDGPVLIVAGAGSGKTRVLTSRIAYLLERGVTADQILALTFTKKAASEMKERIAKMVGDYRARRLQMGTFHSVFIRFLREFSSSLGYPESFTIYDTSDSTSAIKACIKELSLDDKIYKPKDVLSRISMAKNNLVTADAYRRSPNILNADVAARRPRLCDLYSLYVQKCRQAGVMDFDDILLNMNILLRDNPAALEAIAARFRYILVDEYQDTNYAQYLILKKLSAHHRNICVVGDDSQSIYAFRGAKIENILNFKKDYPESRIFRLECNYRSTKNIVNAANSLIAHNEGRIPKKCYSPAEDGEKLRLIRAYTEQEEASLITSAIVSRMREAAAQYQDFAILYRTNSQSRSLEEYLRKRNIPYAIYSGNSFFERAEVKDVMAWFKLVVNNDDDEAFKRAVAKPSRGIGDTTLTALQEVARVRGLSLMKAAAQPDLESTGLKAAAVGKLRTFAALVQGLSARIPDTDAHTLATTVANDSGIWAFYKSDNSIEGMSRFSNVEELLNSVAQFVEERDAELEEMDMAGQNITLGDFLENISLLSNVDMADDDDVNNKVALMTVHSAKGLEFKYVFVAGMEENLFPSGGMLASPNDIEEERRLFYVAITRAEKTVALSYADTRMRNGKHEANSPSRFIREIDPAYVANPLMDDDDAGAPEEASPILWGRSSKPVIFKGPSYRPSQPKRPEPAVAPKSTTSLYQGKAAVLNRPLPPKTEDPSFVAAPMDKFRSGDIIEHNRFGKGKILSIEGVAPELKARIVFDEYGQKLILLKYAKMRIL